jgi:hypothetical protein
MAYIFDLLPKLAFGAPFLATVAILACHWIRCAIRNRKRQGQRPAGVYRSTAALGVIFLFLQVFYRPEESHLIAAQQEEEEDQDDEGDPELAAKTLSRQLKRIRRGEFVGDLTVHL